MCECLETFSSLLTGSLPLCWDTHRNWAGTKTEEGQGREVYYPGFVSPTSQEPSEKEKETMRQMKGNAD